MEIDWSIGMQWDLDRVRSLGGRAGVPMGDVSPPRSRTVAGVGGSLHLLDWAGEGPTALLLHGGALTARTWDFVCLALRHDWRLLALDLRGHGDSHWADRYAMGDYVEDVLSVLDGLELERCHLVGMSLGGIVAGMTAGAHPERFASLTLVDVAPGVDMAGTRTMREFVDGLGEADSVEAVVDAAMRVSPANDRDRIAYRMETLLKPMPDGRWRWKRDAASKPDYAAMIDRIEALDRLCAEADLPVMLVRGDRSRVLGDEAAQRFGARVPGARVVIAPNAGHNVQEDNPAFLAETLNGFWREVA